MVSGITQPGRLRDLRSKMQTKHHIECSSKWRDAGFKLVRFQYSARVGKSSTFPLIKHSILSDISTGTWAYKGLGSSHVDISRHPAGKNSSL